MQKTSILIIGAGPTGLMAACQLAMRGIDFRIVEKLKKPSHLSRALGIQARTMEIFEQMGIVEDFLKKGYATKGVGLMALGKMKAELPLIEMGKGLSPYPYLFILSQNLTEEILRNHLKKLKKEVEWGTEVTEIQQNEHFAIANLKLPNGEKEQFQCNWIIGADGAHSLVRHNMNVTFEGGKYAQRFFLADCQIEGQLPKEKLLLSLSWDGLIAFFPMKGNQRFRVIGVIPKDWDQEKAPTLSQIETLLNTTYRHNLKLHDDKWVAIYSLHHRRTSNFRDRRFFLAGDSAHIHSPAGGQGMNTGLQDAYNLCWKLALMEKGLADEKILETYNEERMPFAKRLLQTTDRGFSFMVMNNPIFKVFQLFIFPYFLKFIRLFSFTQKLMFKNLSQIFINYRGEKLSVQNVKSKLKAGDRFPYFIMNSKEQSVFELLKNKQFNLLISETVFEKEKVRFQKLEQDFSTLLTIQIILKNEHNYFNQLGISTNVLVLVRPDMHIGFIGIKPEKLEEYLKNL